MNDFPIERIRQKTSIIKHGLSKTSVYNSWMCMLSRCYNKKSDKYIYYGARGILVEEKWHSFLCFLDDMGFPERGMTLDRIDVNKGYSPENCRWADAITQARNKTNNRFLSANGMIKTLAEWAELSGTSRNNIHKRIVRGWSTEQAIFGK